MNIVTVYMYLYKIWTDDSFILSSSECLNSAPPSFIPPHHHHLFFSFPWPRCSFSLPNHPVFISVRMSSLLLENGTPRARTNAGGHSPVGPQQCRRQQHLGGIRRTERGIVQDHVLDLVLDDLSRLAVQLVQARPVQVQGVAPVAHDLGNDDGVPRYADAAPGPVVDHPVVYEGLVPVVQQPDDALGEAEGLLVAVEAGQLDAGGVDDVDVLVVDGEVRCAVEQVGVVLAERVHRPAQIDLELPPLVDNVLQDWGKVGGGGGALLHVGRR